MHIHFFPAQLVPGAGRDAAALRPHAEHGVPPPLDLRTTDVAAHPRLAPLPAHRPLSLPANVAAAIALADEIAGDDADVVVQARFARFGRLPLEVRQASVGRALVRVQQAPTEVSATSWASLLACAHTIGGEHGQGLRRRILDAYVRVPTTPAQFRAFLARLELLLPYTDYGAYLRSLAGRLIGQLPALSADRVQLTKLCGVLAEVRRLGPGEQALTYREIQEDLQAALGADAVPRLIETAVAGLASPTALHDLLDLLDAFELEPGQRRSALRGLVAHLCRPEVQRAFGQAWPHAAEDDGSTLHRTLYKLERQLQQLPGVGETDARRLALHIVFPLARLVRNIAGLRRYWQAWCPAERFDTTRHACAAAVGRVFPSSRGAST